MSGDKKTLAFYDSAAANYAGKFGRDKPDEDLIAFIELVTPQGRVLDLGCGPGNTSAILRDAGFEIEAADASLSMVELALEKYGVNARHETFADLDLEDHYDGIWANFSLLHAPREDLPSHLARIARALRPGGIFHMGMKLGKAQKRDKLDRFYTYYSEAELRELLSNAGLTVVATRQGTAPGMAGETEPFIILRAHA